MKLNILYRGPLSSCNYACTYCPFAKHRETRAEHAADARALERFVGWATQQQQLDLGIFFTPWGEALIRPRYQQAISQLSQLAHINKVAIQTNLSCKLDWLDQCDLSKLGLWITYHPSEIRRERFVRKCWDLFERGVRFSVGVVGLRENTEQIAQLRAELPPQIYLWINAFKQQFGYYDDDTLEQFATIDPLFQLNARPHASGGQACQAGHTVISVDGDGTMRRCHFIEQPIGSIYDENFAEALRPRPCTRRVCSCHIGYVHMDSLKLYETFGDGLLERIPQQTIWLRSAQTEL
jgi:MoaA/NifB/PqqE/SkfB family radical SAM enzyme